MARTASTVMSDMYLRNVKMDPFGFTSTIGRFACSSQVAIMDRP
jgi:hypothetical protein